MEREKGKKESELKLVVAASSIMALAIRKKKIYLRIFLVTPLVLVWEIGSKA